jgi:hypothetical protein
MYPAATIIHEMRENQQPGDRRNRPRRQERNYPDSYSSQAIPHPPDSATSRTADTRSETGANATASAFRASILDRWRQNTNANGPHSSTVPTAPRIKRKIKTHVVWRTVLSTLIFFATAMQCVCWCLSVWAVIADVSNDHAGYDKFDNDFKLM